MGLDIHNKFLELDETQPYGHIKHPIHYHRYLALKKIMEDKQGFAYFDGYFSDNHGNNLGFREFVEKGNIRIGFFDKNGNFPNTKKDLDKNKVSLLFGEDFYTLKIPKKLYLYFIRYLPKITQRLDFSYANIRVLENDINSYLRDILLQLQEEEDSVKEINKILEIILFIEKHPIKIVEIDNERKGFKEIVEKLLIKKLP